MLGHSLRFSKTYIARRKREQQSTFDVLQDQFSFVYDRLRSVDGAAYTTPWWDEESAKMEAALLPIPAPNFLQEPTIRWEMVAGSNRMLRNELPALEEAYSEEELLRLLEEEVVGDQILNVAKYHTSINTVHHAHHIHRFIEETGRTPSDFSTVLEWGGGFGSLARLFLRWAQTPVTYVMVDIPFMCALQWLY